jgi:hypothetical protein
LRLSSPILKGQKETEMDLRHYFRKIREVEASIREEYTLMVSLATEDGGKAGIFTEVPRYHAARTIVEGTARLATPEEAKAHQDKIDAELKAFEEIEAARRLQIGSLFSPERLGIVKPKPAAK